MLPYDDIKSALWTVATTRLPPSMATTSLPRFSPTLGRSWRQSLMALEAGCQNGLYLSEGAGSSSRRCGLPFEFAESEHVSPRRCARVSYAAPSVFGPGFLDRFTCRTLLLKEKSAFEATVPPRIRSLLLLLRRRLARNALYNLRNLGERQAKLLAFVAGRRRRRLREALQGWRKFLLKFWLASDSLRQVLMRRWRERVGWAMRRLVRHNEMERERYHNIEMKVETRMRRGTLTVALAQWCAQLRLIRDYRALRKRIRLRTLGDALEDWISQVQRVAQMRTVRKVFQAWLLYIDARSAMLARCISRMRSSKLSRSLHAWRRSVALGRVISALVIHYKSRTLNIWFARWRVNINTSSNEDEATSMSMSTTSSDQCRKRPLCRCFAPFAADSTSRADSRGHRNPDRSGESSHNLAYRRGLQDPLRGRVPQRWSLECTFDEHLDRLLRHTHELVDPLLLCEEPGAKGRRLDSMRGRQKKRSPSHSEAALRLACAECGRAFVTASSYRSHIRLHHRHRKRNPLSSRAQKQTNSVIDHNALIPPRGSSDFSSRSVLRWEKIDAGKSSHDSMKGERTGIRVCWDSVVAANAAKSTRTRWRLNEQGSTLR